MAIAVVLKNDKTLVLFVEKSDGRVFRTNQTSENGPWASTDGGKTVQWTSMGNPGA